MGGHTKLKIPNNLVGHSSTSQAFVKHGDPRAISVFDPQLSQAICLDASNMAEHPEHYEPHLPIVFACHFNRRLCTFCFRLCTKTLRLMEGLSKRVAKTGSHSFQDAQAFRLLILSRVQHVLLLNHS